MQCIHINSLRFTTILGSDVDMKFSADAVVALSRNSKNDADGRWKERVAIERLTDSGE